MHRVSQQDRIAFAALPSGWDYVSVTYNGSSGPKTVIEILSLDEQTLYRYEPLYMIALKCAMLFTMGNPIYFLFYTALQSIRVFTVPLYNGSAEALSKEFWHLIKLPYFFFGMQMAALYGIVWPLEGRAWFAQWETELHDGKTRSQAAQKHQDLSQIHLTEQMFLKENPDWAGFIAMCFQPLAQRSDPRIIRVESLQNSLAV